MGLQEQIAEAIIIAFEELGGDPQQAAEAAMRHDTVKSWLQQETTKIAMAGGAEMIVPGLHGLTIPAGISFLLHKMAHISWGIGALKGAYVVETPNHSDLRNILALWANSSYYNVHLLDHVSVSMESFRFAMTPEGYDALINAIDRADSAKTSNAVVSSLHLVRTLADQFNGDEQAIKLVGTIIGEDELATIFDSMPDRLSGPVTALQTTPMNSRISTKLATRLAAQISMRVPARLLVGFIPVAGAVVNAFFNAQTLRSMADTAVKYYDHQLSIDKIESL